MMGAKGGVHDLADLLGRRQQADDAPPEGRAAGTRRGSSGRHLDGGCELRRAARRQIPAKEITRIRSASAQVHPPVFQALAGGM
jgi:hypothetical protein